MWGDTRVAVLSTKGWQEFSRLWFEDEDLVHFTANTPLSNYGYFIMMIKIAFFQQKLAMLLTTGRSIIIMVCTKCSFSSVY